MVKHELSDRELATVLAALVARSSWLGEIGAARESGGEGWQLSPAEEEIEAVASRGGDLEPLSAEELGRLIARLGGSAS